MQQGGRKEGESRREGGEGRRGVPYLTGLQWFGAGDVHSAEDREGDALRGTERGAQRRARMAHCVRYISAGHGVHS